MRELYWFQGDLRLQDNPGLLEHIAARELVLVYIWQEWPAWCNQHGMGPQRERVQWEHLQALQTALRARDQDLLVVRGQAEQVLPRLVRQWQIERVGTSFHPGVYEARQRRMLQERLAVPLQIHPGNSLWERRHLPFALDDFPPHYTPFRKAVETLPIPSPLQAPDRLPPPPRGLAFPPLAEPSRPPTALPLRGGSLAGRRRLQQYLDATDGLADYAQTRNTLNPFDGSSTLSPWLAAGALSAREVAHALGAAEEASGSTTSTEALFRELLWREFFHWRAARDGHFLFRPHGRGVRRQRLCTFDPRAFARWCQGDTDYPLVNALQRQLVATGWMSNRGRQISASCLIHEMGVDWRFGAAFFEHHLIDFDMASNYGNWQYIAGAGADPRGGRHFNLDKQTREHDPEGVFIAKWGGHRPQQPRYVTDAADWPITLPQDD
ncbi:MAG: deoxyribodipyrimidine photolyase [Haliea sp.]|nr:deoxyribodipyrimidine photolyase [Haliea sp.]|tara:strand:- start:167916 stop:169226 length:1311 start_codon:yes stop_codon:yes gene_type:complete